MMTPFPGLTEYRCEFICQALLPSGIHLQFASEKTEVFHSLAVYRLFPMDQLSPKEQLDLWGGNNHGQYHVPLS